MTLKKTFWLSVLGGLLLLPPQKSQAWNGTGHELVAYIAFKNLTPSAREHVTALLQAHEDYAALLTKPTTPEGEARDRAAFMVAATWPDLVRTPGVPRARYNHPAWHYVDFPYVLGDLKKKPEDPQTHWVAGTDPANAAQAYEKCLADLTNEKLTANERAIALCWVEHLVGDIHQPMHAISLFNATYPAGDMGGNGFSVTAGGKVTNLHALWDALEGDYRSEELLQFAADRLMTKWPRKDMTQRIGVLDFEQWAQESAAQAQETVYLKGTLVGVVSEEYARNKGMAVPELPPGYLAAATNLADEKVALAGYRLAAVLNQTYKSPEQP